MAWSAWAILLVAVSVLVVRSPIRSIFDAYRDGVHHWWAGEPLYNAADPRGFVYLTSSPLLFTPFVLLGAPYDDLLWRVCSVALFLAGIWRLVRIVVPERAPLAMARHHAAASAVRGCECAARPGRDRDGRIDVPGRRRRGAAMVARGGLAVLGVRAEAACARADPAFRGTVRPVRIPLAAGVLIVLAAPFLHSDPGYVLAQDRAMIDTLLFAAQPGITRYNDIAMMLHRFGHRSAGRGEPGVAHHRRGADLVARADRGAKNSTRQGASPFSRSR